MWNEPHDCSSFLSGYTLILQHREMETKTDGSIVELKR